MPKKEERKGNFYGSQHGRGHDFNSQKVKEAMLNVFIVINLDIKSMNVGLKIQNLRKTKKLVMCISKTLKTHKRLY